MIERIFAIWDWPTAIGLLVVGAVVGFALVPLAWPIRTADDVAFPTRVAGIIAVSVGVTFFTFLTVFRVLNGVQFAERTISSGCQWIVFAVGLTLGLYVRNRMEAKR